ncbi:MAG: Holliday junction branch migration protein RuvA [Synechococcaceae cyanobacterium SM2_3_1]|nr:Holliday junction branch migration protein RuvA [Synechococcaceae cyanobacterium SM2_3_1]
MIATLSGTLITVERGDRTALLVEVQGIGFRVMVPGRLLKEAPAVGEPIHLYTQLLLRETEMVLYGFASAAERDVFAELIKVSGVGPALGLALLNTLGLTDLVQAVFANNLRVLSLTPGVGSKTAQRLVLELKTRLAAWRSHSGSLAPITGATAEIQEEVEMALLALGYRPQEIAQALQMFSGKGLPANTEGWLREQLRFSVPRLDNVTTLRWLEHSKISVDIKDQ